MEGATDGGAKAGASGDGCELDCYPYSFSPLLLFAEGSYFDKGYSNYNAVAQFFANPLAEHVNMLQGVLYDRKNMLYEELLEYVASNHLLVTCCIDAHFTAFQVLEDGNSMIYYDPLQSNLGYVSGGDFRKLAGYLLLKCNYGDSQHMQDNRNYYMGPDSNPDRRMLYGLWKQINTLEMDRLGVRMGHIPMDLDRYLLINSRRDPRCMSCQLTGNTCYFQTYLFAVLCKVGQPFLSDRGSRLRLRSADALEQAAVAISRFLLEFFVESTAEGRVMRPLTNSNFVLDFYRYANAPYFAAMTQYLQHLQLKVPDYEQQYRSVLAYYERTKTLHTYSKFTLDGAMSSTLNTKSLQPVFGTDDAVYKLAQSNYYKYRSCNLMFGFNTGIMLGLTSFCEFNALRKNQLLAFYEAMQPIIGERGAATQTNKYRDYYFMPQFEVGQQELIDVHHYTYLIDMVALATSCAGPSAVAAAARVNRMLAGQIYFSTQRRSDYEKLMKTEEFVASRKYFAFFERAFMSVQFLSEFVGLGFADINPREKEINSLTQTSFYSQELMSGQAYRMEHEFEKECINQMARSTLRKYGGRFRGDQTMDQKYRVSVKIGQGFTYSKYNTLMHFLNVMECYWHNPDLNSIQVFGKDIRSLLAISCQKIFFEEGHPGGYYHYGVLETPTSASEMDLAVATAAGHVVPGVSREKRSDTNHLVLTDRVYEFHYLRNILAGMFSRAKGARVKSDNVVLNLCLLSLMLDFGLYEEHAALLNLPFLQQLQHLDDKRLLQVEVANQIHEFDRKNSAASVTRIKLEGLIFEASYKFLVNKGFPVRSTQNQLIQELQADPAYQQQLLLCKVNMSLCQINKSVEVDYYKLRYNGEFRTVIPHNFSKATGDYLEEITKRYTFSERGGFILYDDLPLFDLRPLQPEMDLFRVRFDSATAVQSMVKYIEIKNAFQAITAQQQYLIFIADNSLLLEVSGGGSVAMRLNKITVEAATVYFNEAISFVPCFKYADSEDVILFASRNIHYMVDQGGQFCTDYYGMKHELIECIESDELYVDLQDEHVFKQFKLSELLTESKTVVYFPDFLLQVPSRQELINLLDLAIHVRNLSFFILVLLYLRRCSVSLTFVERDRETRVQKISGPWLAAISYVLNKDPNPHYEAIFKRQFFDIDQHEHMPLAEFVDVLCANFTRYQRCGDDGQYQIVPTAKQKAFLQRIVRAEECFHFSEVGSGKTKVILPLLCQLFLSNNVEAHRHFARSGKAKNVLVVLVPEHLVVDARAQVYRYCLNLNFREEYRVYDDIFALLHDGVQLGTPRRPELGKYPRQPPRKQIFVTSFNQFKKALTVDKICEKVRPYRENVLVVADEVDDFLDRDKLVFNICSNKASAFDKPTLELYFEVCRAAYRSDASPDALLDASTNPEYWKQLFQKFACIHAEIQDASRSVNKSFGIFNEQTLRHCSTNIAHDVEGYKSLIARPYESVNRAMPGSYYSDVERTIYLTFVLLVEDSAKYDELFQQERKFISFEYWSAHVRHVDFDDLVYGRDRLSELVEKVPETKDGLIRFLYEIILRRMEIRDRSRSVNSVDIVFNFDCIGFTGTPFIDNYPTFAYLASQREDEIPDLIDRSFYAYTSEALSKAQFEERFARFQGQNSNVLVEYVPSEFVRSNAGNELAILEHIFAREEGTAGGAGQQPGCCNVVVDLCGVFKRSSIHDVRDLVLRHFGPDRFHYVYHIDQADSSDRVLCVNSDNDVQFDEEFFKFLVKTYGAGLREKVFFFVDNRNVIGKDIPFQLVFQRRFGLPLFTKSAVLAHDVDDFSKIWQAMGRSRTMNETIFSIYKAGMPGGVVAGGVQDIKAHDLTRLLYVRNCDQKMAGNLSSIYQTIVSLFNLSQGSFYFCDEIVNTFLEKMTGSIVDNVRRHEQQLARRVLGAPVPARILEHILASKFQRSAVPAVAAVPLSGDVAESVLRHVVQQKFEQRAPSGDIYDEIIRLLSGEQQSLMEISYTKQQQKQKQKQQNKNQDSDTMDIFSKKHQLDVTVDVDNYFEYALKPQADVPRIALGLPLPVPILSLTYEGGGEAGGRRCVNVYPTLQFLYSHHIQADYITQQVRDALSPLSQGSNPAAFGADFCARFLAAAAQNQEQQLGGLPGQIADPGEDSEEDARPAAKREAAPASSDAVQSLGIRVAVHHIRQCPQYTLAALREGVYVIGMKEQFNVHDLPAHPLHEHVRYVADEMGFVLYDRSPQAAAAASGAGGRSVDAFGPYFVEQYILMEVLSKQEVAQNVLDYYVNHREKLQASLATYNEAQGKGFVCWRFLMNEAVKAVAAEKGPGAVGLGTTERGLGA